MFVIRERFYAHPVVYTEYDYNLASVCETGKETSHLKQVSYWRDFRTQLFGSIFGFFTTEVGTDKLIRNVDKKITTIRCALN